MINRFSLFLGGLGLFALQGCKTQQGEQAQLPNVIYVFPDQYRNQAMASPRYIRIPNMLTVCPSEALT